MREGPGPYAERGGREGIAKEKVHRGERESKRVCTHGTVSRPRPSLFLMSGWPTRTIARVPIVWPDTLRGSTHSRYSIL